jgi:hypothetical protein
VLLFCSEQNREADIEVQMSSLNCRPEFGSEVTVLVSRTITVELLKLGGMAQLGLDLAPEQVWFQIRSRCC